MNKSLSRLRAGLQWLGRSNAPRAVILGYHRVSAPGVDPWHLAVTPEHFAQHLEVVRRLGRPTTLEALAAELKTGRLVDRSLVVTFDDGYANNLHVAAPLLERHEVPATVYVTTWYAEAQREYWWDELDQLLLHDHPLPRRCEIWVRSWRSQWELGTAAESRYEQPSPEHPLVPGTRLAFYHQVWTALYSLAHDLRLDAIAQLRTWSGRDPPVRESHRPMTVEEIAQLDALPLLKIGAHTVTHPPLPGLSSRAQYEELVRSRERLERILRRPVGLFSYPFGAWTRRLRRLVREAGFESATSVAPDPVRARSNRYSLPRFVVRDWDGAEFEHRLSQWLAGGRADSTRRGP